MPTHYLPMFAPHRLNTIMNADKIYVLQAGRITQTGTYDELMEHPLTLARPVERLVGVGPHKLGQR